MAQGALIASFRPFAACPPIELFWKEVGVIIVDVYIGFDSARADKPNAPGAISAAAVEHNQPACFYSPRLVSFAGALKFVNEVRSQDGVTLLALDQPTIVPNETSMRPVERVAAFLVSWVGGGVQPSNRSKVGMFCASSPIWTFLSSLNAIENPELTRDATHGLHLIEVFPALALPSLEGSFFGRLAGPGYNPNRKKTFKINDWRRVSAAATRAFQMLNFGEAANWCRQVEQLDTPRKADQDRLDSMLCLLIGLRWRLTPRIGSLMLGCLTDPSRQCDGSRTAVDVRSPQSRPGRWARATMNAQHNFTIL